MCAKGFSHGSRDHGDGEQQRKNAWAPCGDARMYTEIFPCIYTSEQAYRRSSNEYTLHTIELENLRKKAATTSHLSPHSSMPARPIRAPNTPPLAISLDLNPPAATPEAFALPDAVAPPAAPPADAVGIVIGIVPLIVPLLYGAVVVAPPPLVTLSAPDVNPIAEEETAAEETVTPPTSGAGPPLGLAEGDTLERVVRTKLVP